MKVFVRVADTGSFSRAAETLDVANPTVTTCVRNLERHLRVTLIDRDTRRFRLSEQGERYAARARKILEAVSMAEDEVQVAEGELSGRLQVETTIGLGQMVLSPHMPAFARRYPDITTAVWLTNQPYNLIEHAIDVALRIGHVEDADVVAYPLCDVRYAVCCSPQLATELPAHPADLDPRRCIGNLTEERHTVRQWHFRNGSETVDLVPNGPLHFNSGSDQLVAAKAHVGVARVLDVVARSSIADGSLVQVYPEWTGSESKTLYLAFPKSRATSAKVKAFAAFLQEALAEGHLPPGRQIIALKKMPKR